MITFQELREKVDLAKQMLGIDSFSRSNSEKQSGSIRRSIYSISNKIEGDIINSEDIKIIRPGLGLHPKYFTKLMGAKLIKDLSYGQPLDLSYFEHGILQKNSKSGDFSLEEIVPTKNQEVILFNLLAERKYNISHKKMPTFDEHLDFVRNRPYRGWWLIQDLNDSSKILGSVYLNDDNSLGLNIDLEQVSFSASFFTQKLKSFIKPKDYQPSKIYGDFFYNVSPFNKVLIDWLRDSGYFESQRSFSPMD